MSSGAERIAAELEREIARQDREDHHWCHPDTRKPDGCACGKTARVLRLRALLHPKAVAP